jgi:uncharacterized protein (TIGR02099 family)
MTTTLRRRLRQSRRWLGYGALLLLILVATLVGVINQLLPLVEQHPQAIARWLSERVGEPVDFSSAQAMWTRRGPMFLLTGLRVGSGERALDIGAAQLQVAVYSGLLPNHPLTELRITDLALTLQQDDDGRWRAIGLPGHDRGGDPLERLEGFGELQMEKARLTIRSRRLGVDARMPRTDVRLRVYGDRLRVGASIWASKGSPPVSAVLDLDRDDLSGQLWVGGRNVELQRWRPAFASLGLVPRSGLADADVWLRLREQRIEQVTLDAYFRRTLLESADAVPQDGNVRRPAQARFDELRTLARWQSEDARWRLAVAQFEIKQGKETARLDGLQISGGDALELRAKALDLRPVASLLALTPELPLGLRSFLAQAQPSAVLRDVRLRRGAHGRMQGSLRVQDLSMRASGRSPGFSGLSGPLRFDQDGMVLRADPTPVHFDWPAQFREPLELLVTGTLGLWRQREGWVLGGSGVRLQSAGFDAHARFELGLQGDGSRPTLDLATDLGPASFDTAKKFWLRGLMPAAAVQWLDAALVQGEVLGGRLVMGGDLDDWPFRTKHGAFDARARVLAKRLKFRPDWPEGQNLDLQVAFDGPGFSLAGAGDLLGNRVERVTGGIADFNNSLLALQIASSGRGEDLRVLLKASPLNRDYGEHLQAVTLTGTTQAAVDLRIPLKPDAPEPAVEGWLDLQQATLADSRWDLRLTDVSGRTRFDGHGFASEALSVRFEGQPAVFDLRVGRQTGDADVAALAGLRGVLPGQALLRRTPALEWMRPVLSGSADWQIEVRVPTAAVGGKARPSQLRVRSDLQGIALRLPAPLDKPAGIPMMLELRTALPVEQGLVELRLGDLLRLRGQSREGQPFAGSLRFGPGEVPPMPPQGMSVRGRVSVLDSTGWIAFSAQGEGGATLNDVDVQAAQLLLIDRAFADTHLQLQRSAQAAQIRLNGSGIDGSVELPRELAQGVVGKFGKLHLASQSVSAGPGGNAAKSTPTPAMATLSSARPAAVSASAAVGAPPVSPPAAAATPDAAAVNEVKDPASLPPLRFNIADLRFGQAQLGQTELVTSPFADGMRVEKFQTRSKTLSLDVAGEWVRDGEATRSNMRLEFTANSLGQMLDALGFAGMVEGGKTRATLSGSWPGSPGAFSLAAMSGSLTADVGEGRILDVEPGGSGRILGLMSLAEIPRRLTLDFSDFFSKGFAFNAARGDFVFNAGKARTDNLRIDGPAAEIRVSGTTGLRDQTYDQRVEVLPKAGSVLPAIGMLAGGPAGAAIGAVAQAVLQKPLKQTTRVVYRITGPWDKPRVETIEKGPAPADSARRKPARQ